MTQGSGSFMLDLVKRFKLNSGFTIIELLVAMGIIGLLAVFLIASYSAGQAKARDGRRKADLAIIKVALESYFNDRGMYPEESEIDFGSPFMYETETYFKKLPNDPLPDRSYCYEPAGSLLDYSLGADFETEAGGCTVGAGTPAPTAAGATPVPTSAPTPTPVAEGCTNGVWVKKPGAGVGACVESSSEGIQVGSNCESRPCGTEISDCHEENISCPYPTPWFYSTGRSYTTCVCEQP
mgnify:CR=1 FL=1